MGDAEVMQMMNEEAINYFKRSYTNGNNDDERQHNEALDKAIKALEQTRWIPVSEKPQEGRYLCTYELGGDKYIDFGTFDGDEWYIEPLAYMPLPEPYKESDNNEIN